MSISESPPKFRVAICGAGIAGLVLAITIGKHDPSIPIDIYEVHDSIGTPGVGIALLRQVHNVLIELGLSDDFQQIFTSPENSCVPITKRSDIPEGGYDWFIRRDGSFTMHRQHMVAVLEKHLPASCTVHLKKRLVRYVELQEQDALSSIRLDFADGTIATADVLVGADGIRSAVRETLFETASEDAGNQEIDYRKYVDATSTGVSIYRFVVSAEALRKQSPENGSLKNMIIYCGKGKYFITYPIAQGTLINVAAFVNDSTLRNAVYQGHWVTDATVEEIASQFFDYEPDVKAIMRLCENPSKWALNVVNPLPFCVRKAVALIGDACHAMTPHLGAGAGQGIEDAFVLGRLIAHPLATRSRIPEVLRIYEQVRLPFAQTVARLSGSVGRMYMFIDSEPGYYDGSRKEGSNERGISVYGRDGMDTMKQRILDIWKWIGEVNGGVEAWKEAERKIQALVG